MRSTPIDLMLITLLLAGLAYFAIDSFVGGPSAAWRQAELEREIAERQAEIAALELRRATLEDRTARLRGPVIDRELLDERFRAIFGVAHPRDVVLIPPEGL